MKKVVVTLLVVLTFIMSSTNVQAQVASPSVDLVCDSTLSFDVYPGADSTSIMYCTLSNPNNYNETIEMEYSVPDGFVATFVEGNVVNLTSGEQKEITIEVFAVTEQAFATHVIQINATVTEADGSPPPNVARSTVNSLLNINAYDMYEVNPNFAFIQIDIISADPLEQMVELSVVNNGNSLELLGIESISDLRDELESYNMLVGVPVVTFQVEQSETYSFNFSIGFISEIDTSTWLELDNGNKQVTIDTNITIVNAESGEDGYYCYECNGSSYLTIQINVLPFDSQIVAGDSSGSIPGFGGHLSMVSIILAAFVIARRPQY